MTNRVDYQRMKKGESKKLLAIVQSRRDGAKQKAGKSIGKKK